MSKIKQILRLYQQGTGKKQIARQLRVSKNTVKKYIRWSEERPESLKVLLEKDDVALSCLYDQTHQIEESENNLILHKEMDYLLKELKRKEVTRKLLWLEYKKRHPNGYGYSQFCLHIQRSQRERKSTMVVSHERGDKLYVDFCGKTWTVNEDVWGDPVEKQLFVACLGYSQYAYVEAVDSQKVEDFIGALRRSLEYFGKVPKAIVPDNLKSAVIQSDRYEPKLNRVLEDFANHYGTTIIPARSGKPQDKALVENMVKHVYTQIKGPLRDQKFYSLGGLNDSILEKLEEYNTQDFQRRAGSRATAFDEKKEYMAAWKIRTK